MNCIFCNLEQERLRFENEYAKAFFDLFPVNKGHMLIVPKAHKEHFFELSREEQNAISDLLHMCKDFLTEEFNPDGFNIGWNVGPDSGQTIFHAHCHLIPRYKGDVEKPKGGIRNFKEPLVKY